MHNPKTIHFSPTGPRQLRLLSTPLRTQPNQQKTESQVRQLYRPRATPALAPYSILSQHENRAKQPRPQKEPHTLKHQRAPKPLHTCPSGYERECSDREPEEGVCLDCEFGFLFRVSYGSGRPRGEVVNEGASGDVADVLGCRGASFLPPSTESLDSLRCSAKERQTVPFHLDQRQEQLGRRQYALLPR